MGDGFDGGDMLFGFLFGWLLAGDRKPAVTGHTHGDHWHQHPLPPGLHVHDGHPDGPIRIVPPTPEQVAAEEARRARNRETWAGILGVVALLTVRIPGLAAVLGLTALLLSDTARSWVKGVLKSALAKLFGEEASRDEPGTSLVERERGDGLESPETYVDPGPWDLSLEVVGKPYVVRETHDRVKILLRVVNHGCPVSELYLVASLLEGQQIVGTASGWLDLPPTPSVRTVELQGFSAPPHFDGIEFQVNTVVFPSG